jgi:hypothetical protein
VNEAMNLKTQTKTKLTNNDTHHIGYSAPKGDVIHRPLFGEHLGFLPNTWKVPFQIPSVDCSWETLTLQCLQQIGITEFTMTTL